MKITIPKNVTEISIFLDDVRKTPPGFIRTYTVNETIELIQYCQSHHIQINTLSLDNDLGEFERDGIVDYKFHCINGKVQSCLVCYNRNRGLCLDSYSTSWERTDYIKEQFYGDRVFIDRPKQLDYMLEVSSVLSAGFEYCRVDLYEIDGIVKFGEMTFSPAANIMKYYKQNYLNKLGSCLHLPM